MEASAQAGRRLLALELAAAALVVVLFGLPSLTFPFGPDQGQQDGIGRLVAEGRVLYRDVWDNRPPLAYLLAALGWLVGLNGFVGLRVVELAFQAATGAALAALARGQTRAPGSGLLAAALYGFTIFGEGDWWHTCEPDGRIALFVALALLLVRTGSPGRLRLVGAGLLWGLAFLMKYPALAAALPLAWALREADRARWLGRSALVATGFALVQAAWVAYLDSAGALEAFVVDTVHFNAGYRMLGAEVSGVGPAAHEALALTLAHREIIAPLVLLALVQDRRGLGLAAAWLVAGAAMFLGQGKLYASHLAPALAPLAWLSAAGLCGLARRTASEPAARRRKIAWVLALTLALGAGWRSAGSWSRSARTAWSVAFDPALREAFFGLHRTDDGFSVPDCLAVARYLERHRGPGDRLLVWGFHPILFALTRMEPASRFISSSPLVSAYRWRGYDGQFAEDLSRHPPTFVVVATKEWYPYFVGTDRPQLELAAMHPPLERIMAAMQVALETDTLTVLASRP